jgi:hypothetical protein
MKRLAIILCFVLTATAAVAATYQWTDKKGVVNYTDDPERIPAEYQQRAVQRDVTPPPPLKSEPQTQEPQAPVAAQPAASAGEEQYCGSSASSWKRRFEALQDERKNLAAALPEMEKELQRKRVKYLSRTGRGDGYYNQKKEYLEQAEQYKRIQERKADADQRQADLDLEAARCGVPLHLRQ